VTVRRSPQPPVELRQAGRGPGPVLGEGQLHQRHRRALQAQVGVAPGAETLASPHVLVADVQAPDKGHLPVHDHDLAVIAEVQLETVAPALGGAEGVDLDAGRAQLREIAPGQGMAADLVVEQVDAHALPGLGQQVRLQLPADVVVVDDEELDQDVALGRVHGCEDGLEGGLAADQQAGLVARGERRASQAFEHAEAGGAGPVRGGHVRPVPGQVPLQGRELGGAREPRPAVAQEAAAAEDPVEGHGHVGEGDHGHDPGDGALGGAGGEQSAHGREQAEDMAAGQGDEDDEVQGHGGLALVRFVTLAAKLRKTVAAGKARGRSLDGPASSANRGAVEA